MNLRTGWSTVTVLAHSLGENSVQSLVRTLPELARVAISCNFTMLKYMEIVFLAGFTKYKGSIGVTVKHASALGYNNKGTV